MNLRVDGHPGENILVLRAEGLLQAPERSRNNYRRYGPAHVERLHLIRNYRARESAWMTCAAYWVGHMRGSWNLSC